MTVEHPRVLVLGEDQRLARDLGGLLTDVVVRQAWTAPESEGIDIDVVVVGGEFPMEELNEVRVHPRLGDRTIVLVAPGRSADPSLSGTRGVHAILTTDHVLEAVATAVREALGATRPALPPAKSAIAPLASALAVTGRT